MRFFLLTLAAAVSAFAQDRPGVFDFYLLSLSWSPQYCAGPGGSRDPLQCGDGRQFGFVVHGLWPQFERGWPRSCGAGSPVDPAIARRMLPLMPSERLIQHEWDTHGVCSGLAQRPYFDLVRRAFEKLRVPQPYRAPLQHVYVNPREIKTNFAAANPGLPESAVRVLCSGRYLSEVRVCFSKDLEPRPCPAGIRDTCRAPEIIMQPVR